MNEKKFWSAKAATYPLPFYGNIIRKTRSVLAKIRKKNFSFRGKSVLDIGCGTGIYSLPLAARARTLTALDFSPEMLDILKREAAKKKIKNLEILECRWEDFKAPRRNGKKFDACFASMTAAVKKFSDVKKMEDCAREFCAVVTWAGARENAFMDRICAKFGVKRKAPDFAKTVEKYLKAKNRKYAKMIFTETWNFKGTPREAAENMMPHLRINGAKTDLKTLERVIREECASRTVRHRTRARKALFVWKTGELHEH